MSRPLVPEKYEELYMNSVYFKRAIDSLIPTLIDALALYAEQQWQESEARCWEAINSGGPLRCPEGVGA